ncbi:MAG: energy-coupling factor transporter transmembrane component T [Eggerthellaceae bacterium]
MARVGTATGRRTIVRIGLLWHTRAMNSTLSLYIPGTSFVHTADARVKIVTLLAVSVTAFLVSTWAAEGVLAAFVLGCIIAARLSLARLLKLSVPLLVILAFMWVCNAFSPNVFAAPTQIGIGALYGFADDWAPVVLWGEFGFSPQGCMLGLGYAARILVVFFAGYLVSFTTTSEALTAAFLSLLRPLRVLRVPVDDVAMVLSLALRFIPLMAVEAQQIRRAQLARGARFDEGGLWKRISAWHVVLVPLVVAMFHRAATLACAMEARCYGAGVRSRLDERGLARGAIFFLVAFVTICIALVAFW